LDDMNPIWERVESRVGGSALRAGGVSVADVVGRLEAGEAPARVAEALALGAPDLIAALAHDALGDDGRHSPPLIQSAPRRPRILGALSEGAWTELFPRSSRTARLGLAAGLLQVHDFWDASHEAAQQADDLGEKSVSAYWHGIAHRREPDAGNAAYWFRRVGRHPLFAPLATALAPVLESHGDPKLTAKLTANGSWNPFAFIDLCTQARPDTPDATLARELQRLEMIALLGHTATGLT
jgi:hypothetical protein